MIRLLRRLAPLAAAGTLLVPAQSHATQTLVYTWVFNCASPTPIGGQPTLTMPTGTYAFTVEGACSYANNPSTISQPGTPCTAPVVGPIPCVASGPLVNNAPGIACRVWTGPVTAGTCSPNVFVPTCAAPAVLVDGTTCVSGGAVTLVPHLTANKSFAVTLQDGNFADNVGVLTVTAVWTPL